jgi:hypothetical protein
MLGSNPSADPGANTEAGIFTGTPSQRIENTSGLAQGDKSIKKISPFLIPLF